MSNPLFMDDDRYKRNLNVLDSWVREQARILALTTGRDYFLCHSFVKKKAMKAKENDVTMRVLRKDKNGDRVKDTVGFIQYLEWVEKNQHIIAPNMIAYTNPSVKPSYTAMFVRENLTSRSRIKKEGQRAKQLGDLEYAYFCNLEQANKKFFNNSLSGTSISEHNPLFYMTKHTTFTSTCRSCTSIANAINEKLNASNRHYYNYDVTLESISYIINKADMVAIENVVSKYGMVIPTAGDVKALIFKNTSKYWRSVTKYKTIETIVDNMSDMERVAFTYTNDLNMLCAIDDKTMRTMYDRLVLKTDTKSYTEDVFGHATGDMYTLAGMICFDFMKDLSPSDLKDKGMMKEYQYYIDTLGNIMTVMLEYGDILKTFFINDVQPQNIFELPHMRREAVPASDTDSSIFTAQNTAKWYNGAIDFTIKSIASSAVTAFISSTMIAHGMFKLSRQLGVSEEEKYRIAMKGEYFFPVLVCTNMTKHYAYLTEACEGKIYEKPEFDAKGVQLISSKVAPEIMNKSIEWYEVMLTAIRDDKALTPIIAKAYPAYLEHSIYNIVMSGDMDIYSKEMVKSKDTYKLPYSSNWAHIDRWNNSYSKIYGTITDFPVYTKKVPVTLSSFKRIEDWAKTLTPEVGEGMLNWCIENKKKSLNLLLLPPSNLPGGRLPEELRTIVDVRGMLSEVTDHCYKFLSTLGVHVKDENNAAFASDHMSLEEAKKHLEYLGLPLIDSLEVKK